MRKLTFVLAVAAALVVAGLAVAKGLNDGAKSATAVAGTFTATTAANVDTRTCTTPDGKTIAVTKATYTGTAAGSTDLTGAVTLQVRSLINTTDNVGAVSGHLTIDTAADKNTRTEFSAVYDKGKLAGLAAGRAGDKRAQLLANLSAGFSATGGFTDGKLGASAGGSAVELGPGTCKSAQKESSSAKGAVSAVSATSITVAGLQCDVPASFATKIATVKVGDRAEIHCNLVSGKNTLVKLGSSDKK
ncbi:MAG: hypothetical protein QOE91_941 [Gaiellaceae bacterium]|jgi:hypothetical protein|nr:hypothetical protein [Gaiellaceae bacterium]